MLRICIINRYHCREGGAGFQDVRDAAFKMSPHFMAVSTSEESIRLSQQAIRMNAKHFAPRNPFLNY